MKILLDECVPYRPRKRNKHTDIYCAFAEANVIINYFTFPFKGLKLLLQLNCCQFERSREWVLVCSRFINLQGF